MRQSPEITGLPLKHGEAGYVLITAIWLLVLAGSIVAVVTLRTLSHGREVKDQATELADRVNLESAAETVFADRLFAGNKGRWWLTPASGQIMTGGKLISVVLTSESGRLDLNEADSALIDQALQGLGVDAAMRTGFLADVKMHRAGNQRINTFSELRGLLGAPGPDALCIDDSLTLWSGLPVPRSAQMPGALARALGQAVAASPAPAEVGAALRLRLSLPGQPALMMVARPTGLRDQPVSVSSWEYPAICDR